MAVAIIMMIVYDDCGGSCSGENDIDDDKYCGNSDYDQDENDRLLGGLRKVEGNS